MADTKISALTALGAAPATNDLLVVVDDSDHSMAASGTDKKLLISELLTAPGISGAATFSGSSTYSNGSTANPGPHLLDQRGDELGYGAIGGNLTPGKVVDLQIGTSASPVTTIGGVIKISKTENYTASSFVANSLNEQSAGLVIHNKNASTSEVQSCCAYLVAESASTVTSQNDDAMAIGATGRIIGSGTGYGIGGYFVGRRETATGRTNGAEIRSWNNTSTDQTYSTSAASEGMGIWLSCAGNTSGTRKCGVAIAIGRLSDSQWDVGIGVPQLSVGSPVATTTFQDDCNSVTSIKINGSHTNGIDMSGGTFSGKSLIPPNRQTYTITNGSTDRALNVTGDTTAQVAAVLGTLLSDLQAIGLVA